MDAWILNVTTLTWKKVEEISTEMCCYSNMYMVLFKFDYHLDMEEGRGNFY